MKKILIIRFSSIGDIVLTSPILRCLKLQGLVELHYLTKRQYGTLLSNNPHIDKLIFLQGLHSTISQLKSEKYDLIIDIQGDEPLISPDHIDKVINEHLKNFNYDIILPSVKSKNIDTPNIVKVVINKKKEIMYLSRASIPYEFKKKKKYSLKHLSIISFKPKALLKFKSEKQTLIEKIEGIELMRALEIGLRMKTIFLKGRSFSVDVKKDFIKAKKFMKKDSVFRLYKKFI